MAIIEGSVRAGATFARSLSIRMPGYDLPPTGSFLMQFRRDKSSAPALVFSSADSSIQVTGWDATSETVTLALLATSTQTAALAGTLHSNLIYQDGDSVDALDGNFLLRVDDGFSLSESPPAPSYGDISAWEPITDFTGVDSATVLELMQRGARGPMPGHEWTGTALALQNIDGTWEAPVELKGEAAPNAWAPIVDFAAGISAQESQPTTVVRYQNETYIVAPGAGSFTTTGTFSPAQWVKIAAKGADGDSAAAATFAANAATSAAQTAADRAQTGLDRTAADASAAASAASAATATGAAAQVQAAMAQISAIGVPALPYIVDGFPASAIFSAPSGAMMLSGAYVADTALLTISSGSKWVMGPAGLLVQVAANALAYDYSSGRRRLRIEPKAATNLLLQSNGFDNSPWIKQASGTGSTPAITPNYGVAPDGSQTSTRVVFNVGAGTSSGDQSALIQTISVTAGTTYQFDLWIKGAAGTKIMARGAYGNTYTYLTLTGGWQRLIVPETTDTTYAAGFSIGIHQGLTGGNINAVADVELWHCQVEAGTVATSIIPTTTAAVTRIADDVRLSAAALAQVKSAGGCTIALRGGSNADGNWLLAGAVNGPILTKFGMTRSDYGAGIAPAFGSGSIAAFGAALTAGNSVRKGSFNGGAVATSGASALWDLSDETALRIGAAPAGGAASPYVDVDELVVWPLIASNAGAQAQARIYA